MTKRNLVRWFATVLLLGVAFSAQAIDCSELPNGSLDGFAGDVPHRRPGADRPKTGRAPGDSVCMSPTASVSDHDRVSDRLPAGDMEVVIRPADFLRRKTQ